MKELTNVQEEIKQSSINKLKSRVFLISWCGSNIESLSIKIELQYLKNYNANNHSISLILSEMIKWLSQPLSLLENKSQGLSLRILHSLKKPKL